MIIYRKAYFSVWIGLFLLNGLLASGQDSIYQWHSGRSSMGDTNYYAIKLKKITDTKIIEYNFGKNATIYIAYKDCADLLMKLSNGYFGKENRKLLKKLNKRITKEDTLKYNDYDWDMDGITSELLEGGNAEVYDKRTKKLVNYVLYRLERYGEQGWVFYYLSDKRPFAGREKISGIIEKGDVFDSTTLSKHYSEYLILAKKIQECGK